MNTDVPQTFAAKAQGLLEPSLLMWWAATRESISLISFPAILTRAMSITELGD